MAMSLTDFSSQWATATQSDTGGLSDTPATVTDRDLLLEHLGRDTLHVSKNRNFSHAYWRSKKTDTLHPRLIRVQSKALGEYQYVKLTHKEYAAVMVIDIDQTGTPGGHPSNLNAYIRGVLRSLISHRLGPAWIGINPVNGRAQALWLIDPVYADASGESRNMTLLAETVKVLGSLLDYDQHCAKKAGFSRSPFYTGKDPEAYKWYRQHNRVVRLGDFIKEVRKLAGIDQYEKSASHQQFTSGRDLINAVKSRREQAEAFRKMVNEVEAELSEKLDQYDSELVEGVRIRWGRAPYYDESGVLVTPGRADRDETAFRHAVKVGHRLKQAGKRLTDAALIDAYEHAYKVAQQHGGAGRSDEMPPMRDRLTMARRVRGYVTQAQGGNTSTAVDTTTRTSSERKALATMGRKGGQKAAQRWKTDPEGEYAQSQREKLEASNAKRAARGRVTARQIANYFDDTMLQTGLYPSIAEAMEEFGVSRQTINRALKRAEISLPRGRKRQSK